MAGGRFPKYAREARLLADLAAREVPVAPCRIVRVEGIECAVAPRLHGVPVHADAWTGSLVASVARMLAAIHATASELAVESDPIARFHLGRIWPFDGSSLGDHPIAVLRPAAIDRIGSLRTDIERAAAGPLTVVHTDLHRDHVLVDDQGRLVGLLDFGDAFAGVAAWDHACLRYYYGADVARRVAEAMGAAAPDPVAIDLLSVVWCMYKLSKTPDREDIRQRVEWVLNASSIIDIP